MPQQCIKGKPTGYIIDESSHLKKRGKSVAVSRQYAGVTGKADNCQVGVCSSLVNQSNKQTNACIINERLFLPKSWTVSPARYDSVGIPDNFQQFKTKPQLALDMIKQDIERGVKFDWIGGDGLYGHNVELCDGIEKLNELYVLNVHEDERVFLGGPTFSIPEKTKGRGRKPTKTNQK